MIHPLVVLSLNLLGTQSTFESICVMFPLYGNFIINAMTIFSGDYSVDYSFVYPDFYVTEFSFLQSTLLLFFCF